MINMSRKWKDRSFIAFFLIPALFLYVWFMIYPCIKAFIMSLYEWNGYSKTQIFVGLQNYAQLFQDAVFYKALKNNLFILFWCTICTFAISIFFAAIITRKKYRERNVLRVIYFIPYALSVSVVSMIWMFIYNPSFGALNSLLDAVGFSFLKQGWLADKNVIMGALTVPLVWINIGFYMVMFITSIMDVPGEQYDAASIDGADEIKQFFYITIPNIWEMIRVSMVFFVVTAFNYSFELVYVITKGGPNRASELVTTYLYEKAFRTGEYGYASAMGVVLFVIVFLLISVVMKATEKEEKR